MTNEELKQALLDEQPVCFVNTDGTETEFKCISGIAYRCRDKKIVVSVELLDKSGMSVIYCDPKRVRLKGGALCD